MHTPQTPAEIVRKHVESWPDRKEFLATAEQMKTLIATGAERVVENKDNGDGTFYNELVYENYTFKTSTTERL